MTCPFCAIDRPGATETAMSRAFPDAYPLNLGHMLVTPKRHVARIEELRCDEAGDLWALVDHLAHDMALHCDGLNIGVNSGPAAGQTIDHLHVHIVPRYEGDTADPRGGVRWVIPERADYWSFGGAA